MAALTIQTIGTAVGASVRPGPVTPTYAAASAGGDTFANDGKTFLHIKNGGGSVCNVTVDCLTPSNYGTDVNATVAVTNGQERILGPFKTNEFNNSSGVVSISYDQVSSVTIAAFKLLQ